MFFFISNFECSFYLYKFVCLFDCLQEENEKKEAEEDKKAKKKKEKKEKKEKAEKAKKEEKEKSAARRAQTLANFTVGLNVLDRDEKHINDTVNVSPIWFY